MAGSVEDRIRADPEWQEGMACPSPGSGHPEATVGDHVEEVLANVERHGDPVMRARLRVIALVHDAMKCRVRWWIPGRTDHARLAARWAESYIDDPAVLKVIARHDDAYRAWRFARRTGLWAVARLRVRLLIADLGGDLELFRTFYRCDNETGDKAPDDREWFDGLVSRTAPRRRPRPS
jgi:HD domain-containing protein